MYYTADVNTYSYDNYPHYVDLLRIQFTIRVEVKSQDYQELDKLQIEQYLLDNVNKEDYHTQRDPGHNSLFYSWFMHEEDALAFALKFGGKVV